MIRHGVRRINPSETIGFHGDGCPAAVEKLIMMVIKDEVDTMKLRFPRRMDEPTSLATGSSPGLLSGFFFLFTDLMDLNGTSTIYTEKKDHSQVII